MKIKTLRVMNGFEKYVNIDTLIQNLGKTERRRLQERQRYDNWRIAVQARRDEEADLVHQAGGNMEFRYFTLIFERRTHCRRFGIDAWQMRVKLREPLNDYDHEWSKEAIRELRTYLLTMGRPHD